MTDSVIVTKTVFDPMQDLKDRAARMGMVVIPLEPSKDALIAIRAAYDDYYSQPGEYPRAKAVYNAVIRWAP